MQQFEPKESFIGSQLLQILQQPLPTENHIKLIIDTSQKRKPLDKVNALL